MKLQRNHVATEATQRDTVGRNRIRVISGESVHVKDLDIAQRTFSSDNVEKMTHVIIVDPVSDKMYLLKYRLLYVETEAIQATSQEVINNAIRTTAKEFRLFSEAAIAELNEVAKKVHKKVSKTAESQNLEESEDRVDDKECSR